MDNLRKANLILSLANRFPPDSGRTRILCEDERDKNEE